MVELMSLAEQVDKDFSVARRRAWFRRMRAMFSGWSGGGVLLDFHEVRRRIGASGGFQRGRSTVEISAIVGSAGKHGQFDEAFMPLRGASPERWKRIDRAFRIGIELPPVSLYLLGGGYFVQDGHHRVSVARFHRVEWMDAEVTEFRSAKSLSVPSQLRGSRSMRFAATGSSFLRSTVSQPPYYRRFAVVTGDFFRRAVDLLRCPTSSRASGYERS